MALIDSQESTGQELLGGQGLRIHLPIQGTQSLIPGREDSTSLKGKYARVPQLPSLPAAATGTCAPWGPRSATGQREVKQWK